MAASHIPARLEPVDNTGDAVLAALIRDDGMSGLRLAHPVNRLRARRGGPRRRDRQRYHPLPPMRDLRVEVLLADQRRARPDGSEETVQCPIDGTRINAKG